MAWNIIAVVLSSFALVSSTVLAARQTRLSHRANQMPTHFDISAQFRSVEFNDHYEFVTQHLAKECDAQLGLSGLSDRAREAVYDVGGYLQGIATMRLLEFLDDRIVAVLRIRVIRVWAAVAPFVLRERELQGTSLWRLLEEFAADAEALPDDIINVLIDRRRARSRRIGVGMLSRRQRLPR